MPILVLPAQGLEIGGVIALAGIVLARQQPEGTADRDLVQRPEAQAIDPATPAEMLQDLPGDHRALAARIGGDDDPLDAAERLADRRELRRVRLARAAVAGGDRQPLHGDRQRVEAPGLPVRPDLPGSATSSRCPSAATQTGWASGRTAAPGASPRASRRRTASCRGDSDRRTSRGRWPAPWQRDAPGWADERRTKREHTGEGGARSTRGVEQRKGAGFPPLPPAEGPSGEKTSA